MVRELLEVTLSGNFDPIVRKRLAEVVQLVQSYCRLAKLELASVEAPRFPGKDYVALPENTIERAKEWAEVEAEREKQREAFTGKLRALEKDPRVALEAME
ncbi:MAG TPA: hypothetical protein VIZ60_06950 [Rubrobacter sp.]|jgi:hypothetical protein